MDEPARRSQQQPSCFPATAAHPVRAHLPTADSAGHKQDRKHRKGETRVDDEWWCISNDMHPWPNGFMIPVQCSTPCLVLRQTLDPLTPDEEEEES
jgi:hypothetical protein